MQEEEKNKADIEIPNLCVVCHGSKVIRYKREQTSKVANELVVCPICFGTGKIFLSENEAKKAAKQLVAKLLRDALQVGFHLDRVHQLSHDSVFTELKLIVKNLEEEGKIYEIREQDIDDPSGLGLVDEIEILSIESSHG